MSQIEKLCGKFNKRPIPNDITFEEVVRVFEYYGCIIEYGGKHPKVIHKESGTMIPVPRHGKNVAEAYIKELKDLLSRLKGYDEL